MKGTKRLICTRPSWQSSNRLVQNLHLEAFCKENGIEYVNPTFADMAYRYVQPCHIDKIKSPIGLLIFIFRALRKIRTFLKLPTEPDLINRYFSKVGLKYILFDDTHARHDYEKILHDIFYKHNTVIVEGFFFRVPWLTNKYQDEMSRKYSLKSKFFENNNLYKKIVVLKQLENILIAVHIRRGDYSWWRGGKFYFEDDVYKKYMSDLSQKIAETSQKQQFFIIFSNDIVKFDLAANIILSKECWFIDQHLMSMCDYIIGPPSTFSAWANYMGKNKLYHILDASGKIDTASSSSVEFIPINKPCGETR